MHDGLLHHSMQMEMPNMSSIIQLNHSTRAEDSGSEYDEDTFWPRPRYRGSDLLARTAWKAPGDCDRIKNLLEGGVSVTNESLLIASEFASDQILKIMLSALTDPNLRSDAIKATSNDGVRKNWALSGQSNPSFHELRREFYPIQYAAYLGLHDTDSRDLIDESITLLVNRGADLYALFRQPLREHFPCYYPGESIEQGQTESDNEWNGVDNAGWPCSYPPRERSYGLRSVIHAMLEDGAHCLSVLKDPSPVQLDVERRDPQGRTMLLSTCRSALGADAAFECVTHDAIFCGRFDRRPWIKNPFIGERTTLFQAILNRGANLIAVDDHGKNALHNLFEAHDAELQIPPINRETLQYLLKHASSLVNRTDHLGMSPLITALQRMRRYREWSPHAESAEFEASIGDLLAAGANPLAHDNRGNNALHYLASTGLAECRRDSRRQLFMSFVSRGVDVNEPNNAGQSPLELFLNDVIYDPESLRWTDWPQQNFADDKRTEEDFEKGVLEMFDQAGTRWKTQNRAGQTMLHVVAKCKSDSEIVSSLRAKFLLDKGVDPTIKDDEGNTALQIAIDCENRNIIDLLESIKA